MTNSRLGLSLFCTFSVEIVGAVGPGQVRGEGGEGVVDGPGDDHVVVEAHEARGQKVGESQTLEQRSHVGVEGDGAEGGVLTQADFEEEAGDADEEQHEGVGDQERAAAMLVAEVGKPPNVSKTWKNIF